MQLIVDEKKIKKTFLLLLGGVLTYLVGESDSFVDNWYAEKFYPLWSNCLQTISNFFPFSIGDLFYIGLLLYIGIQISKWFIQFLSSHNRLALVISVLNRMLQFTLIGYILFQIFWGFNYRKGGIALQLGLNPTEYKPKEITYLTNQLIDSANFYRKNRPRSFTRFTKAQLIETAQKAYNQAALDFPFSYQYSIN